MTRTSYIPTFLTPLSLNHQKLRTRLTTISSESDEDISEPNPHERPCPTSSQPKQCSKSCSSSSVRRYNKKSGRINFPGLNTVKSLQVRSTKSARKEENHFC